MLQACLNGSRSKAENPQVPISHEELATAAAKVKDAGAEELHVHPRNEDGMESLVPEDVGRCLQAIRQSVPGMPVGVGTGAWIEPNFATRLEQIKAWEILPDYASVNLNEAGAAEVIEVLLSRGVGIEAGVWNARDAEYFVDLGIAGSCLRILVEMISDSSYEAEREYVATKSMLDQAGITTPILLHGDGGSAWRMVELAAQHGHDTRIGFEDCLLLPTQAPASTNSELVSAAREILHQR